ncbi:hypothetical protein FB451DRAFT_1434282 [Mycena latifolia]|nr:hypothetical protein FB451DRAFT_1434282 [Mycena latifolia]
MAVHHTPIFPIVALALITVLNILAASTSFRALLSRNGQGADPFQRLVLRPATLTVEATEYYGLEAEDEWSSLMPMSHGFGFIRLGPQGLPFEPSVYHQLHCLNALRKVFTYGASNMSHEQVSWHTHHCLNYLRQAILCNADTTLEPSYTYETADNVSTPAASGIGVAHTCVDWTQLRSLVEDNQAAYRGVPIKSEIG